MATWSEEQAKKWSARPSFGARLHGWGVVLLTLGLVVGEFLGRVARVVGGWFA